MTDNHKVDIPSICANCGKGEESTGSLKLKKCAACHMLKYCNRECQIAHRPQHKKACKNRAAELYDEKLFEQPPPEHGDCQICFLRLPFLMTGRRYMACCGKCLCSGCIYAPVYDHEGNEVDDNCPFCRTPPPSSDEEMVQRIQKRMEAGDAEAMFNFGQFYDEGSYGFPRDIEKALELWHQAGELGCTDAYYSIGVCYTNGEGAELDEKKAVYYYELAAIGGDVKARHNLGVGEANAGKMGRALKHWMIAVRGGHSGSLNLIKDIYTKGYVTKDDYTKALKSYQEYLDEIKSDQRDKAAAEDEDYKYY